MLQYRLSHRSKSKIVSVLEWLYPIYKILRTYVDIIGRERHYAMPMGSRIMPVRLWD